MRVQIGFASEEDFIASKCIAGGQQDLHDVVVLTMKRPELLPFAEAQAEKYKCRDKLDAWAERRTIAFQIQPPTQRLESQS